jgi:hypothetical protein
MPDEKGNVTLEITLPQEIYGLSSSWRRMVR